MVQVEEKSSHQGRTQNVQEIKEPTSSFANPLETPFTYVSLIDNIIIFLNNPAD